MFKCGIYIAVLVGVLNSAMSFSDEHKALIETALWTAGEKCISDHPLKEEDIAAFKEQRFPEGRDAACFGACVLTNVGLLDDKGKVTTDEILERANAVFEADDIQRVKDFLDTCVTGADEKGEDGCERAKHIFQCFVEKRDQYES